MIEQKVEITYLGPMGTVVIDELGELTINRGESALVPKWFADEKLARDKKRGKNPHWKLAATAEKKKGGDQ